MDNLLSVRDICARYQVKPKTARAYMRSMAHMKKPLMVSEWAVKDWEAKKTVPPLRKGVRR